MGSCSRAVGVPGEGRALPEDGWRECSFLGVVLEALEVRESCDGLASTSEGLRRRVDESLRERP